MKNLPGLLEKAVGRRRHLSSVTNAMRLVNGIGDGLEGLLVDRYNKHLQIQILAEPWPEQITRIAGILTSLVPVEYMIVKSRRGLDIHEQVLMEGPSQTTVEEDGLVFTVDLHDGLNCGLFLDMRKNRRLTADHAKDKKILNCFSYTCSFGVHARQGGAREVINTDISRKTLERGMQNYKLNGFSYADGEFVRADSVAYLQRAFKKGNSFDLIILDPPSFARHKEQVFQVKRDLPKVMALATGVLNPGGAMLVTTNYSELSHADLERMLSRGLNGRRVKVLERVGQDEDFVGSNTFKESYLAGLWVKFI